MLVDVSQVLHKADLQSVIVPSMLDCEVSGRMVVEEKNQNIRGENACLPVGSHWQPASLRIIIYPASERCSSGKAKKLKERVAALVAWKRA